MVALPSQKTAVIQQLRQEILSPPGGAAREKRRGADTGLGLIEAAFPQSQFPLAAVHEFISVDKAGAAATAGFVCALLKHLVAPASSGPLLWVSTHKTVYPPALAFYGIAPERVVFVQARTDSEALWVIEEALKCKGLTAVVGEVRGLSFTQSRRLQLAVEGSGVTGFIHRCNPYREAETNACVTRWRIAPLPSASEDGLPGVSHPRWRVHLQKVRNGQPGVWHLEWVANRFRHIPLLASSEARPDEFSQKQKAA